MGNQGRECTEYTVRISVDPSVLGAREVALAWLEVGRRLLPGGKQLEYAPEKDRFENFGDGAKLLGTTPELTLIGYCAKHLSPLMRRAGSETLERKLNDLWDEVVKHAQHPNLTEEIVWEKALDFAAYMVLLTAMVAAGPLGTGLSDKESALLQWSVETTACGDDGCAQGCSQERGCEM